MSKDSIKLPNGVNRPDLGIYDCRVWESKYRLKIVKVNLKRNTGIYHTAGYLTSFNYGMMLYDKAHLNKSCCPTSSDHFEIPPELNIDVYTYWAGSQHFSLKEIEVYQVMV